VPAKQFLFKVYSRTATAEISEDEASSALVAAGAERQVFAIKTFAHAKPITVLRIDPSEAPVRMSLEEFVLCAEDGRVVYQWDGSGVLPCQVVRDISVWYQEGAVVLECLSNDPFMVFDVAHLNVGREVTVRIGLRDVGGPMKSADSERSDARVLARSVDHLVAEQEDLNRSLSAFQTRDAAKWDSLNDRITDFNADLERVSEGLAKAMEINNAPLHSSLKELSDSFAAGYAQLETRLARRLQTQGETQYERLKQHGSDLVAEVKTAVDGQTYKLSTITAAREDAFREFMGGQVDGLRMDSLAAAADLAGRIDAGYERLSTSQDGLQLSVVALSGRLQEVHDHLAGTSVDVGRAIENAAQFAHEFRDGVGHQFENQRKQFLTVSARQLQVMNDLKSQVHAGFEANAKALTHTFDAGRRDSDSQVARRFDDLQAHVATHAQTLDRTFAARSDTQDAVLRDLLAVVKDNAASAASSHSQLATHVRALEANFETRARQNEALLDELLQNFAFVNKEAKHFPVQTAARVLANHYRFGGSETFHRSVTNEEEALKLIGDLRAELVTARAFVETVLTSRSWFFTKPIRAFGRILSRVKQRLTKH